MDLIFDRKNLKAKRREKTKNSAIDEKHNKVI